jgi:uncharacterized protein (DUF58 family)
MIAVYPTRATILLAAAVAPAALVVGVFYPAYWLGGLALLAMLIALCAVDALSGASARRAEVACEGPGAVGVGESFAILARINFRGPPPHACEVALGTEGPVAAPFGWRAEALSSPAFAGEGDRAKRGGGALQAAIILKAERRGTARLDALWIRFPGPLGLVWKQRRLALGRDVLISPDIRPVREASAQFVNRDATHGLIPQLQVGEGAEFEALTDYRTGMDRRSIDWKTSARHTMLIAKEYRTERNNNIVMAVDSGRIMCEPISSSPSSARGSAGEPRPARLSPVRGTGRPADGPPGEAGGWRGNEAGQAAADTPTAIPRVDHAVSAALLTAYVALKDGDRVGLFAFDSRPRASSRPISGPRAFPMLQRVAAGIEYSALETNYTLALATLAESLTRRSLIVVFTEFADTISADLMLNAVGTLLKRHLILFVVLRDEELEAFTAAEPAEPADVSRAVMAAGLLRERRLVLTRLRHMGVHVIEAPAAEAGPALVNAYLDLKRRDAL